MGVGPRAYRFWRAIREKNGAKNPEPFDAVFHGSRDFELRNPFLRNLKMDMRKYFGDLTDECDETLLGGAAIVPLSSGSASCLFGNGRAE
jgi:hypothetical protein